MLALLFTLSLLAVTDSIPAPRFSKLEWINVDLTTIVSPAPPTVQVPPIRDVYQYPVGFFRRHWRCDVPLITMIHGTDTLSFRLTKSENQDVINRTTLPETATVNVETSILRFTQDKHGRVLGKPRDLGVVPDADLILLEASDLRWNRIAPPPPTLPRRTSQAVIRPTSKEMRVHPRQSDGFFRSASASKRSLIQVDWPRYTAVLYGDTLTSGLYGTDQELAMRMLGYSETDTYDLFVTIERYVFDLEGSRIISGPTLIGPMPKATFDRLLNAYANSTAETPLSMIIYEHFPAP